MFWVESTFKTAMPENVLDKGYSSYIKSKTEVLFPDDEVEQIVTAIQTGKLPRTWSTHREHVASLKERHSKPETPSDVMKSGDPNCPKCGSAMLKRSAKSGANAGNEFWGCSRYPGCRGIVNI